MTSLHRAARRTLAKRKRVRRIGPAVRVSAALGVFFAAMFLDLDPAPGFLSFYRTPEPAAAAAATPVVWAYDMDADGAMDFANPTHSHVRATDAYGDGCFGASRDGGRRKHQGADYVVAPGGDVHAPISGDVTRIGEAYRRGSNLNFIELRDPKTQVVARVFYVDPNVAIGDSVTAGEAIGAAQDLSRRYPGGITNHVHVELTAASGDRIDPELVLPNAPIRLVSFPVAAR